VVFFLNPRVLKSETTDEVRMEDGARIECFNFLNFFLVRDLVEMAGCNISVHFALRSVDSDLLDEAVRVLRADSTIVKIVRDDDKENVGEYPQFMVRLSME
jgi:hypothetical protein